MPRYERQGHQDGQEGVSQEDSTRGRVVILLGSVCGNRQARIRNNTIEKIGYNSSGEEALVRNQEEFFFRFSSSVFFKSRFIRALTGRDH